ncbi:unnamed protein product [Orchesella dallaii]|uniref:Uncharacterized protein n=1 Tax=Orchesella dallaii TaxID=48710 RepID=A0ABP1QLQ5_9HEXA
MFSIEEIKVDLQAAMAHVKLIAAQMLAVEATEHQGQTEIEKHVLYETLTELHEKFEQSLGLRERLMVFWEILWARNLDCIIEKYRSQDGIEHLHIPKDFLSKLESIKNLEVMDPTEIRDCWMGKIKYFEERHLRLQKLLVVYNWKIVRAQKRKLLRRKRLCKKMEEMNIKKETMVMAICGRMPHHQIE